MRVASWMVGEMRKEGLVTVIVIRVWMRTDWVIFHVVGRGLQICYAQAPGLGRMPERFGWWSHASGPPYYWMSSSILGRIGLGMRWWRISRWGSISK